MYFLRWLKNYPISAMLAGVVLFALFNWGSLDRWFGKEAPHQAQVVETHQVAEEDHAVGGDDSTSAAGYEVITVSDDVATKATAEAVGVVAETVSDATTADDTTVASDSVAENDKRSVFSRLFKRKESSQNTIEASVDDIVSDTAAKTGQTVETVQQPENVAVLKDVQAAVEPPPVVAAQVDREPVLYKEIFPTLESAPEPQVVEAAPQEKEIAIGKLDAGTAVVIHQPAKSNDIEYRYTLESARTAFWKRDTAASNDIYKSLIKTNPDNPDLLGEYGNMLFQTGNIEKAVDTYEKVVHLLIDENRIDEAGPLIMFIGKIDRSRAGKLVLLLHERKN